MAEVLTEEKKAEVVAKEATKDAGSQPIKSDQDRAAFSVSPVERQRPSYD